ncbi:spore germination protein [Gorillibacterium massiliense]|uniref:spore germination protein n=1 Tax=Gorillibacterium massiliense TaxID=1280390 RepID=UPI0004B81537|nr:spore germination protein [Gorillibacterium massiliense]
MNTNANADLLVGIQNSMKGNSDVTYQPLRLFDTSCMLIYIESIVDTQLLHVQIASPLLNEERRGKDFAEFEHRLGNGTIFSLPFKQLHDSVKATEALVEGSAILYIESMPVLYSFTIPSYKKRSVTASENELVVIGPQEAFIEDIKTNLSLLRHKIKQADFKTKSYTIGNYTKTTVCLVYIEGLSKPNIIEEMDQYFTNLKVDGILGVSSLAEHTKEGRKSPFPQYQYTERPDSVAASLLEGRIGILQDGTPSALLLPVSLFSLLQSSEDYYQSFFAASWVRMVRFLFSAVSLFLPSLYVAITTFQPEIIPSDLLLAIEGARERIPFTTLTEAMIMELTFEALREAGTRIPKPIGQTISIIGAIVIGQAAVQAGIVSTPVVIVVSITGISSYIVPHLELGLTFRLLRFPLLIAGGYMGLLGVFIFAFLIYGHLASLKSFNTPYLYPVAPLVLKDWKDVFLRVPSSMMKQRPAAYAAANKKRQAGE